MPDTNSRDLIMSAEKFPAMRSESNRVPVMRRWSCPDDHTIAAYVDNALPQDQKVRAESHLSHCQGCRLIVADVVKIQREAELPVPPFEVAQKAVRFVPTVSARLRWIWAPMTAVALIILITVSVAVHREPEQLVAPSPRAPAAPMVARAEPLSSSNAPPREILRRPAFSEVLPIIIFPLADTPVAREHLKFSWKPVSHSRYYEIRVVTSDGDLLWEGQTEKSVLRLPSDVGLKRGSYFVWITAYLADGRVAKSSPVRFVVKG
jgi:hypothetical protein